MIIRKGDKGNVDFEKPLHLDPLQKERFLNFMKNMFYHVEEKEVNNFRAKRMGEKTFTREWEDEEYELLFRIDEDNNAVSRKLGRSWMSVEMKRVVTDYVTMVMKFAEKNKVDVYQVDMKKLVRDFLKEHKDRLTKKREHRSERNKKLNELRKERDSLRDMIPKWETVGLNIGHITPKGLQEKKDRLIQVEKEIKKLEEGQITIHKT